MVRIVSRCAETETCKFPLGSVYILSGSVLVSVSSSLDEPYPLQFERIGFKRSQLLGREIFCSPCTCAQRPSLQMQIILRSQTNWRFSVTDIHWWWDCNIYIFRCPWPRSKCEEKGVCVLSAIEVTDMFNNIWIQNTSKFLIKRTGN